jgi:uncharacterized protein (DUF885 family)
MHRFRVLRCGLVAVTLSVIAWAQAPAAAQAASASAATAAVQTTASPAQTAASQALAKIFDDYFEASLVLNPVRATSIGDNRYNDRFEVDIAPEWLAKSEKLARDSLAAAEAIDRSQLNGSEQLSYDIFTSARRREIEGYQYPDQLLPFDQFDSTPNDFVQLGSGDSLQPFKTVKDYDDFLKRIDGFVAWTKQAVVNMREGVAKGYTQPRILMERTLPQLEAQLVDDPEKSLFWGPIRNMPADFSAADKARLTSAYRDAIRDKIVPAYRSLHEFIRTEYLPKCRTTVGLDALPNGAAWYAYNVRTITTTDYTPARIHEIGLAEVARIQAEMDGVMSRSASRVTAMILSLHADRSAVLHKTRGDLIAVRRHQARMTRSCRSCSRSCRRPTTRFFDRTVPPEERTGRTVPGGKRGWLAAGRVLCQRGQLERATALGDRRCRCTRTIGHHLQITIQREQQGLKVPSLATACSEGWGLYAGSLGRELGMRTRTSISAGSG